MILVGKPTEAFYSLYVANAFEPVLGQVADRYLKVHPAVRALAVIVLDELLQHAIWVSEQQVAGSAWPDLGFARITVLLFSTSQEAVRCSDGLTPKVHC